jgi:hypothetical protein
MLVCVHTFDELVLVHTSAKRVCIHTTLQKDYMVYTIVRSICTSFYKGVKAYAPFAVHIYTHF